VLLSATAQKLQAMGVQTLGVVASTPERTHLYFRFRPPRMRVGADPDLVTHRAYGLPNMVPTAELTAELWQAVGVAAAKELEHRVPASEAYQALGRLDGYRVEEPDLAQSQQNQGQLTGQFLVDRDGLVAWANVECARDGIAGVGQFPSDEELLAAARALR
jgi:hypothetical protein